ncbi:DUF4347 domain-containing protein [Flagellimonas nanhaiensis]|uniref:DUF4347 domain-containing protein n=1 Tax=Flagellimonas nanhaiensis TaxID=2292706 RepID=A0A371JLD4_9FLAO|nr:DUF4347 domain-containing protein [Allomuricauda nanhaiensis]RDY57748.1 DUF4347 domain-containing protein [Allomuricauda nanhaiensis]
MKNQVNRKSSSFFFVLFILFMIKATAQSDELIIIDSNYSQKQQVLNNKPAGSMVLEIGSEENAWKVIRNYLEQNQSIEALHLFANANYNSIALGSNLYDSEAIDQEFELSMLEGLYQGTNLQLLIYDCNLGSNAEGLALLKKISERSYFNIAIPTNCSSVMGNDLVFDHTTLNQPIKNSIFQ